MSSASRSSITQDAFPITLLSLVKIAGALACKPSELLQSAGLWAPASASLHHK